MNKITKDLLEKDSKIREKYAKSIDDNESFEKHALKVLCDMSKAK